MRIARVYDEPNPDDGVRVLVDRLWPRGLRKNDARIDRWCKNVAPSTELRHWYGHQPERFAEFAQRYLTELERRGLVELQLDYGTAGRPVHLYRDAARADRSHPPTN